MGERKSRSMRFRRHSCNHSRCFCHNYYYFHHYHFLYHLLSGDSAKGEQNRGCRELGGTLGWGTVMLVVMIIYDEDDDDDNEDFD